MTIAEDCAQVTLNWGIVTATEDIFNVFGIRWDGLTTPNVAAQAIADAVNTNFLELLDENLTLETVHVVTFDDQEGFIEAFYSGEQTYAMAPPNVTHLFTKRTGYLGRGQQGRMYLPGVDESNTNAGGQLATGYRTTLNVAATQFLEDLDSIGLTMVLLHADVLVDEGPPPVYEPSTAPVRNVTSLQCQTKVATQRRRVR